MDHIAPTVIPELPPTEHLNIAPLLHDRPVDDDSGDLLDFASYADALAEVIDNPSTDTPLTLAISAPWGAGKTSLARLVAARLIRWPVIRGERPHVICWFNAWMHDDAPELAAAFAAEVARTANTHRSLLARILTPIPSPMLSPRERSKREVGLAISALIPVLVLFSISPLRRAAEAAEPHSSSWVAAVGGSAYVLLLAAYVVWGRLFAIAGRLVRFIDDPRAEAARGEIGGVASELSRLIRQVTVRGRRFVVFVDDLERCRPPAALEICEAASQLLDVSGVVTVLVGDMSTVERCADIKYSEFDQRSSTTSDSGSGYGRLYLEKIVQLEFDLPAPPVGVLRDALMRRDSSLGDADRVNVTLAAPPEQRGRTRESRADLKALATPSFMESSFSYQTLFLLSGGFLAIALGAYSGWIYTNRGSAFGYWISEPTTSLVAAGMLALTILSWQMRVLRSLNVGAAQLTLRSRAKTTSELTVSAPPLFLVCSGCAALSLGQEGGLLDLFPRTAFARWLGSVPTSGLFLSLLGLVVVRVWVASFNSLRRRRATDRLDVAIRASPDFAHPSSRTGEKFDPALAEQRTLRFLGDESDVRRRAETALGDLFPVLPRAAKRLLNRLRLTIIISERRGLLAEPESISPDNLARVSALAEARPDFTRLLTYSEGALNDVSTAASEDELIEALGRLGREGDVGLTDLLSPPLFREALPVLLRYKKASV